MATRITPRAAARPIPQRGPIDPDDINDALDEIRYDLQRIITAWNDEGYNFFRLLPSGASDTRWTLPATIHVINNGLDGTQVFVDNDASSSEDGGVYWESEQERPKTIKEAIANVRTLISTTKEELQDQIDQGQFGIADSQKLRIGWNIFDSTKTSSASSLDGMTAANQQNILQLAKDLYDDDHDSLDGDGAANLTYSLRDHIVALLGIHSGTWDSDLTLDHSSFTPTQAQIASSASYTVLNRAASVTTLEHDLNRLRYEVGVLRGNANWAADFSPPGTTTAVSLYDHVSHTGSGSQTTSNPHGLRYDDIDGLVSFVETSRRYELEFTNHTVSTDPLIIIHNQDKFPIVQLVDQTVGVSEYEFSDYAVVDEVYAREGILGISTSTAWLSIEHVNKNITHVYTNAQQGIVICVF
jgi:hypothetical protein